MSTPTEIAYGTHGVYILSPAPAAGTGSALLLGNDQALSDALNNTFNNRGAYNSGANYAVNDVVLSGGTYYIATAANTNQTPPNASYWSPIGGSAGALIASNNLSDLASASTARTNLGLGSAATTASTAYDAAGLAAGVNTALTVHENNTSNPHSTTAAQVGLSAVTNALQLVASNNLSDLTSASAARTALGLGSAATTSTAAYDAAGAAAAVSTSLTASIATKLPLAGGTMTGNLSFSSAKTINMPYGQLNELGSITFQSGCQLQDNGARGLEINDGDGNVVAVIEDGGAFSTYQNQLDDGNGNASFNGDLGVQGTSTATYSDGIFSAAPSSGEVILGDAAGDVNGTYLVLSDPAKTITVSSANGVTINGPLTVNGAVFGGKTFATAIAGSTCSTGIEVYFCNAAFTITMTLPSASTHSGAVFTIKSIQSAVTVNTTSSQTIDGSTTYSLTGIHKYVTVISNGSSWQVIANN